MKRTNTEESAQKSAKLEFNSSGTEVKCIFSNGHETSWHETKSNMLKSLVHFEAQGEITNKEFTEVKQELLKAKNLLEEHSRVTGIGREPVTSFSSFRGES